MQVQTLTAEPATVDPFITSRQRFDDPDTIEPLALSADFWLLPPLQSQTPTVEPGAVLLSKRSRHLPLVSSFSSPAAVTVHF